MSKLLWIAAGGSIGALLRYGISGLTYRFFSPSFPWGTLAANLTGCFLIGFLWSISERYTFPRDIRLFVFTGVIGALTTFSTYGLESINLVRDGEIFLGIANIAVSNALGLALVFCGSLTGQASINLLTGTQVAP